MLYVSTRNHQDTVTVARVLSENRAADGGLYLPLRFPQLTEQECSRYLGMSFGQCVAEMLNLFFSSKLTGWDVDFSVGRYPVRLEPLGHRILMAETWHNLDWQYQRLEKNLKELLQTEADLPGSWATVALRMAVLAGILANLEIPATEPVDISVVSGDFTLPISAWYLRKMGFPIGNIICSCNENNQFWELLCNGQMKTDAAQIPTIVPEGDISLPENLERLIADCGGTAEALRYGQCCAEGSSYKVAETLRQRLHRGLFASVVSSLRLEDTIPNVYKTHHYLLSPASALAYSGLMDYRTKTGITRTALVICDQSPVCRGDIVARAMDMPVEALKKLI